MRRLALRVFLVTVVASISLLIPRSHGGAAAATTVGSRAYYLALGDSLAYGYQPSFDWTHGYADDLFAHFQPTSKMLVNLSCLGETTTTFISGGCPYWFIRKTLYSGSQLSAAMSFIANHPGQVSPVTIDIGGNDILPLVNTSTCTVASNWTTVLAAFDRNFTFILASLQHALKGSGDLASMIYYDPYQNVCARNPDILSKVELFDLHIAADSASFGARVANVFGAFGGPTTPNRNLCTDTWMCSVNDIHATTHGYSVIASAFDAALGY
jgi:lysophospholipase L1-like esterase